VKSVFIQNNEEIKKNLIKDTFMSKKRVLVIGVTGEIGSRVGRGCVDAGYETIGVSRGKNTRHRVNLDGVKMIVGDQDDESFYDTVLSHMDFDTIVNTVPTPKGNKLVHKYFNGRIEHYFICSSTGTFVPLLYLPADENHPWREQTPVNFWSSCTRDIDALLLYEKDKFPVVIFRPTNIIGPGRIPINLWGGRSILYYKRMKEGKPVEIPVSGSFLIQSGYNDDLASAFVKAITKGNEISGEIFIISCKKAITLDRYFSTARDVLRSSSAVEYLSIEEIRNRYPEETTIFFLRFFIEHMCFDISKAEGMLGYSPRYSTEEGLVKSLEWCLDEGLL